MASTLSQIHCSTTLDSEEVDELLRKLFTSVVGSSVRLCPPLWVPGPRERGPLLRIPGQHSNLNLF
jgi:hypothetical protein